MPLCIQDELVYSSILTTVSPQIGGEPAPNSIGCATAPTASSSRARASANRNRCPKTVKTRLQNQAKKRILETLRNRVSEPFQVASLHRSVTP